MQQCRSSCKRAGRGAFGKVKTAERPAVKQNSTRAPSTVAVVSCAMDKQENGKTKMDYYAGNGKAAPTDGLKQTLDLHQVENGKMLDKPEGRFTFLDILIKYLLFLILKLQVLGSKI